MMPRMKQFFVTLWIAACAGSAGASGLKSLEIFIKTVNTGKADFSQEVTAPAKEGQTARVKKSAGQFEFARPNRFKFSYTRPFTQTIVADSQTLWLFDADLNQVTARRQSQALGGTPAALMASAANLQALQVDFVLTDAPDKDGLQWVLATPKNKEGTLQTVRVGLRQAGAGVSLEVLEMLDNFGQRSVLKLQNMQLNPKLSDSVFEFKPPADADLVRQ